MNHQGDVTTAQVQELRQWFERFKPEHDAAMLAESVAADVNHWRRREAAKRRDDDHIRRALKKVDAALSELESVVTDEARHLKKALLKVKEGAGSPVQKNTTVSRSFINLEGGEVVSYDAETVRKNTDEAALIWHLQAFWIKRFGESPKNWRDHPFYEMAAIVMGKNEASAVWAIWNRNGNKTASK